MKKKADIPPAPGLLITFEGIEGSGKSLQMDLLSHHLQIHEIPHVVTREPGGTEFGKRLRAILLESGGPQRSPVSELLLYLADRYQDLAEVIEPALKQGRHVLCDRYHDATRAYQGCGRGIPMALIDSLARTLKIRRPSLTLLLDLPVTRGLERARGRNTRQKTRFGRFEAESLVFHRRVRRAYREFAIQEPDRFHVVNAARDSDRIHRKILEVVSTYVCLPATHD